MRTRMISDHDRYIRTNHQCIEVFNKMLMDDPPYFIFRGDYIKNTHLSISTNGMEYIVRQNYYDANQRNRFNLFGHTKEVNAVRFLEANKLISAGNDLKMRLWNLTLHKELSDIDEIMQYAIENIWQLDNETKLIYGIDNQ